MCRVALKHPRIAPIFSRVAPKKRPYALEMHFGAIRVVQFSLATGYIQTHTYA